MKKNSNFLYCPVRDFKVKRPKGHLRRQIVNIFDKKIYSERNKIETIMFLLKHKGIVIRSKKNCNKIKELAWKILAYNIERLTKSFQRLWLFIISLDKPMIC